MTTSAPAAWHNEHGAQMKVKIFDEEHEGDLEEDINRFFQENPDIQVRSVQFRTCCAAAQEEQYYCFSVMILYENKPG